jgi:hypothetical protein
MGQMNASQAVHAFLSCETTKGRLLSYMEHWQREFSGWTWRYARDDLQPGDWVLDLVAPTGETASYFLHPADDVLRLVAPVPLTVER